MWWGVTVKKENRLKKNDEFQLVFKRGTSVANRQFVIYYLKKQDQANIRIGISVNKKIGNAVKRNQIKRYIREVMRELIPHLDQSYDLVIIARKPTSNMGLIEIKKSLHHVLKLSRIKKR